MQILQETNATAIRLPVRILLVDDDPTNLQVLSKTLEGHGFELLVARDGESTLAIARKAHPALILLDVMLPNIDGFEVCRRLKADDATRDASVIFLSALGEAKEKVVGLDLGAVDYITKPFNAEEVLARVNTHLTIRNLQNELLRQNQQLILLNARMTQDLQTAAKVQQALLPKKLPKTDALRFSWIYRPCHELGGDSLNIFQLAPHSFGIFVLDVAGHGVSASLLSVAIAHALTPRVDRSSIVTNPDSDDGFVVSPAEVAGQLNRMFPMNGEAGQFVTLLYGVLDTEKRLFRFANAGHPPPLVVRSGNSTFATQSGGLPIGVSEITCYDDYSIQLSSGDRLLLYTDGMVETENPSGDSFGNQRLLDFVQTSGSVSLDDFVGGLERSIVSWSGKESLDDDLSLVAVEFVGSATTKQKCDI